MRTPHNTTWESPKGRPAVIKVTAGASTALQAQHLGASTALQAQHLGASTALQAQHLGASTALWWPAQHMDANTG